MGDLSKYREYARRVKIFHGMDVEAVRELVKHGTAVDFHKGQTVFHEGQRGNHIFIVLTGKVGIYNKDHLIAICRVGDAFGEMSVLDHEPHSASAAAVTDVHLLTLDEFQIREFLSKRHSAAFLLNIIHELSKHLRHANTENAILRKQLDDAMHASKTPFEEAAP